MLNWHCGRASSLLWSETAEFVFYIFFSAYELIKNFTSTEHLFQRVGCTAVLRIRLARPV